MAHLSSNIFARLETLKKWQEEQQQRLIKQQAEQNVFLTNEQKRLNEALDQTDIDETPIQKNVKEFASVNLPKKNLPERVDEQLIVQSDKDFNQLLAEKLQKFDQNEVVKSVSSKPKRPFLKKGAGLARFRMVDKKTTPRQKTAHKKPIENTEQVQNTLNNTEIEQRATWANVLEKTPPFPGEISLEQRAFEKQLERELALRHNESVTRNDIEELKIFEILEEKALNSSFCSTSSVITRLLGICTPIKSAQTISQRALNISEEPEKTFKDESVWESENEESESEETLSESSSETVSSQGPQVRDFAVNTEVPYPNPPNTDLLRTRLEELEKEIEIFRQENSKATRLKNDFDKHKNKLEKEVEEKQKQLDEEKKKLNKEKQLLSEKYIREMKNGSRKEREEISALKNQLASVKEELKMKESRYGASQARQRNQIRSLEKEVAALKVENDELRRQNGKLQTQIQQHNRKNQPPSDTKVLHEINKNLSLLTKQQRRRTVSDTSSVSSDKENNDSFESERSYENIKVKGKPSKSSADPSFETIARDYERVFGRTEPPPRMDTRASSESFSEKTKPALSTATTDRIERLLLDGSKEITYSNGNVKIISGDKVTMKYYNGDVKETNPEDATIRYYYAEANIWHTTYAEDGVEVIEFPDGQIEKRKRDGSSEVTFPDGCMRCTSPAGTETVTFLDGTIVVNKPEGEKILTLPNGQKEIHTAEHKRREYPDGTVKILYPDGTQETRYANGRIRLKDINGYLIMDTADVRCLDSQD